MAARLILDGRVFDADSDAPLAGMAVTVTMRSAPPLSGALTGSVRASAMLVDTCHTLIGLAEKLLVIRRQASRLMLMAAVEAIVPASPTPFTPSGRPHRAPVGRCQRLPIR